MGRGNPNLIAWDGSKTITFTVEDALFSTIGISILMGADIAEFDANEKVHVHKMIKVEAKAAATGNDVVLVIDNGTISTSQPLCETAPLFIMETEDDNSITGDILDMAKVTYSASNAGYNNKPTFTYEASSSTEQSELAGKKYIIDCYVIRDGGASGAMEIQVRKDKFAGYFYVEAETLYRRQDNGADLPAVITIPKVKIQSNFSFSMSADGDPSTATFTMDAFPDYTYFDKTKEVLVVIQVINDAEIANEKVKTVMGHDANETSITYTANDGNKYKFSDSYAKTAEPQTDHERENWAKA